MAITIATRGTGGNNTAATTLAWTPSSAIVAGSLGVFVVALDNAGSAGATPAAPATFTDASGNTWTRQQNPIYDPGAASAGVEVAIYTAPITTALSAATTITWAGSASVAAKAWAAWQATGGPNASVVYLTGGVGTGAASGTPTLTTVSIAAGDAVIGFGGAESANTWTGDADTSNGTWSAQQAAGFGTTTSGMSVTTQYKVVTATATQTYNPTLTSADQILGYIVLHENPPSGSFTANAFIKKVLTGSFTADAAIVAPQAVSHTEYYAQDISAAVTVVNPTLVVSGVNWAAGDLVVAVVAGKDNQTTGGTVTATGLTFSGTPYLADDTQGQVYFLLWWANATSSGSNQTVSIDLATSGNIHDGFAQVSILVIHGLTQNYDVDVIASANTGATDTNTPSVDITAASDGRMYAFFNARQQSFTPDAADSLTQIRATVASAGSGSTSSMYAYYKDITAGSYNASGTMGGALDWVALAFTVKPLVSVVTNTGSFTANAYISKTTSQSVTADAFVKRVGISQSFTANAYVKKTIAGSFTADAYIKKIGSQSITADAFIKRLGISQSVTADAYVKRLGISQSFTANAQITKTTTQTFTANANIKSTVAQSFTANANLKATVASSFTANAFVKKLGIAGSFTANAQISKSITQTFTADAYIKGTKAGSFTANAQIKSTVSQSFTANAFVKRLGIGGSFAADAYIKKTFTGSFTADAYIKKTFSQSITANAYIKKIFTASITADAFVKATRSGSFTADARIFVPGSTGSSFTADAFIRRVGIAASFTANAYIAATKSGSFTANAQIKATRTGSATVDAFIRKVGISGSFAADAFIRKVGVGSFTASAYVSRGGSGAFTADAYVRRPSITASFTANAFISKTFANSFSANAFIRKVFSGTFTANAMVRSVQVGVFTADAWISNPFASDIVAKTSVSPTLNASVSGVATLMAKTETGETLRATSGIEVT